jgi:WD40 repeat protein
VGLSSAHVYLYNPLWVNGQDSNAEIFDVFLCHSSADKPAVRQIAQNLAKVGINLAGLTKTMRSRIARLWEAEGGKPLVTFQGHTGSVNSAVFGPDGRRVLTAPNDKAARLWETSP